jgi:KUP system potassium uptake protein
MTAPLPESAGHERPRGRYLLTLSLTALGVVYGDIGTSPLYAVRECFFGLRAVPVTRENVLGILSLIFWSLIIVVTAKYHVYVIRAANRGEGGILALMALVRGAVTGRRRQWVVVALGLFGGALLYGDGVITPAITVLGAVEGLNVATPVLSRYVVPFSIAILTGLFLFQRRGTAGVGRVFGPVLLVWFITIATLGIRGILMEPGVLEAVSPVHAVRFFAANRLTAFVVLGAVFLVATGGEALYADLGHFGERPIQLDWFTLVGPSLVLNYFGQGALLLAAPGTVRNPFYQLAPDWALYPLVALATMAAVIASQAIISGAFSLTRQAVQLGYLPRMSIVHTSARKIGQIYVPGVNWALAVATIGVVLAFRTSSGLAHAYGVAVTTTMIVTTALAFVVTRKLWGWPLAASVALTAVFLFVDLAFFTANIMKIQHGGWFPLVVAAVVYTILTTWQRGRAVLRSRLRESAVPLEILLDDIAADPPTRVPGTAVFLTPNVGATPAALVHNLAHNKVLHHQVVFVSVLSEEVPTVGPDHRVAVRSLGNGFHSVTARYGFMEEPSMPDILARLRHHGLDIRLEATTFFLGRETLVAAKQPAMARWREGLFALLSRNALSATAFFRIPPAQVFEVGVQVEM